MTNNEYSNGKYTTETYDVFNFYGQMSPLHLCYVCLLEGIRPPSIESFNYIELGCGYGISTNVFAAANPQGNFYGLDFNPKHISEANKISKKCQIKNVQLIEESFSKLGVLAESLPKFDFIILHGVFTWVSHQNRQYIIEFIRKSLKDNGIVYVSYNCAVGWAAFLPIRNLMFEKFKNTSGCLEDRAIAAFQIAENLIHGKAMYLNTYPSLIEKIVSLKSVSINYFLHEFLNEEWNLFYQKDLTNEFKSAEITYVGSTNIIENIENLYINPDGLNILNTTSDQSTRETFKELLTDQLFRPDVYVRNAVRIDKNQQFFGLKDIRLCLLKSTEEIDYSPRFNMGTLNLNRHFYQPIIKIISENKMIRYEDFINHESIKTLGTDSIFEVVNVLVASSQLQILPPKDHPKESTVLINQFLLDLASKENRLQILVSPVAATGIQCSHLYQIILLGEQRGEKDLAKFIYTIFQESGFQLIQNGKKIPKEAIFNHLQSEIELFREKRLPLIKALKLI